MRAKRNITPEEVRNAKLLLSKGLSDAEVAAIIGRSVSAVVNMRSITTTTWSRPLLKRVPP